jgi:hypothetical protein
MLAQSSMNLLGQSTTVESNSNNNTNQPELIAWNLDKISSLLSYDLITAVQSSTDTSVTITKHITDLNSAITSLTQQSRGYQSQIEQSQSKLTDCSSDKKIADAAVVETINQNDLQNINNLIQASIIAGQCEAQHRITINALTLVTKKYSQAIVALTKKINLIEQHKSVIAQYPEVIADPEIIKELSQISSQF